MKIIEINKNLKKLVSDEGKSLYENREYLEDETPYYFKEGYLPLTATLEECKERYNEILDSEIIIEEL